MKTKLEQHPNVIPETGRKSKSRADRWAFAVDVAERALRDLIDLQAEFQEWRDNLPENLTTSALGEKLDAVCDLDLEVACDTIVEAASLDLPLGFGRD